MRVPDISATAGNAAQQFTQPHNFSNNGSSTQSFSLSVIEGIQYNNKNGNWMPTAGQINAHSYLSSNQTPNCNNYRNNTRNTSPTRRHADDNIVAGIYSSTADEFIQKALSSAPTPFCESFDSTTTTAASYAAQRFDVPTSHRANANAKTNNTQNVASHIKHNGDRTCNNTFAQIFSEGTSGGDNNSDLWTLKFDNIKSSWPCDGAKPHSTDLDPFMVRSQPPKIDKQYKNIDPYDANDAFTPDEQLNANIEALTASQCTDNAELDGDDHSMLDLCPNIDNDNNKSTLQQNNDDELDEYLTSPTSSSVSLNTPQRYSYFPRGIINPNYPGFQHLAHTLSEHFVGSFPSDSYDSDMSEYDMELSADSWEEVPAERQMELNMKMNIYNNNSGNNTNANTNSPALSTRASSYMDANSNNNDSSNLHDNLKIVLSLDAPESTATDVDFGAKTAALSGANAKSLLKAAYEPTNNPKQSITPDILIKNYSLSVEPRLKKENRPDLLRGVSPQPLRTFTPNPETLELSGVFDQKPVLASRTNEGCSPFKTDATKDEVCFGMTPVDIIGDFEQEVEREFGLLVSGYRRLMDAGVEDCNEDERDLSHCEDDRNEKLTDATLSSAKDHIDTQKFVTAFNQTKETPAPASAVEPTPISNSLMEFLEDNNAVDWSLGHCDSTPAASVHDSQHSLDSFTNVNALAHSPVEQKNAQKPKYHKSSYDERQLPPVAIEYKRCQQSTRTARKSLTLEKSEKNINKSASAKVTRQHMKPAFTNRFFNVKRSGGGSKSGSDKADSKDSRKREEAELHQYQQLISDKELILSNSRYTKLSVWAQYLKNSVKEHNSKGSSSTELVSPSALDLFDAYKIGTDFDMETLQNHLKMAKEIEKKRRSDREEIRRRLAMGAEENCNENSKQNSWKPGVKSRMPVGIQFGRLMDPSSDTESHSSDSETCPKLSKTKHLDNTSVLNATLADKPTFGAYGERSISCNSLNSNKISQNNPQHVPATAISSEDRECDFFTKQARLQIEARMALAQAKEMAHMQMEIERQNQRVSPITDIIRVSLQKVGVQMTADKRRVSRQMLTDMNIAQLQILVNSLHTHIEKLNESLVHNLMERDDLHVSQDGMLVDIEELTRYISANEQKLKIKPNLRNQAI